MARRKIVVDGAEWLFSVGKQYVVAKNPVTNEGRKITVSEITGWTWTEIERSLWKGGTWAVRPHHVAKWLRGAKAAK
jgi:hypothetical protein